MIDHQLGGLKRIDLAGIAAQLLDGVAHGGEVHDRGDAGEILHEHSGGGEGDFLFPLPAIGRYGLRAEKPADSADEAKML